MRLHLICRPQSRPMPGGGSNQYHYPGYCRSVQRPGFCVLLAAVLALTGGSSGCANRASRDSSKEETPYTRKVSSSIRDLVEQMSSDGAQPEMLEGEALDQRYSSSILRVDREGRIQCYILLDPFGRGTIDSLRTLSLIVEREEPTLKLIQAWVPFEEILSLSEISFVSRIRPPDYPAPR